MLHAPLGCLGGIRVCHVCKGRGLGRLGTACSVPQQQRGLGAVFGCSHAFRQQGLQLAAGNIIVHAVAHNASRHCAYCRHDDDRTAAVTAAETGQLVLSTLHTIGAAQTIDRIIDVCPAGAQNQIRGQLAAVLRGVITQQLLPLAVGKGRCAATEILVGTDAVANLIREGKCYQIPSILQSGAALGMHSLNADLARLVSTGRITREAAERCATNKSDLKNYL